MNETNFVKAIVSSIQILAALEFGGTTLDFCLS